MVKVVKQGNNDPNVWVWEKQITCDKCGTVYQVEPGDRGLKIYFDKFESACPVCGAGWIVLRFLTDQRRWRGR